MRSRRAVPAAARAVAIAAVLAAAGCAKSTPPAPTAVSAGSTAAPGATAAPSTAAPGTSVGTEPVPATSAPAPTTSAPTTPKPPTAPSCATPAVPAGASDVTTGSGDFDGNGSVDTLRAYRAGPNWHLRTELVGKGAGDITLADTGAGAVSAMNGSDVDGDGRAEVFAQVGSGASAAIVAMFRAADCSLVAITLGGAPFTFTVGASVGSISGAQCGGGEESAPALFVATGASTDGASYTITTKRYTLSGDVMTLAGTEPSHVASFGDEAYMAAASFGCPGVTLVP